MKKLIITNWKNYVNSIEQANELFELAKNQLSKSKKSELIICPSYNILLQTIHYKLPTKLGAQDISLDDLSEMSTKKLKKLKVKYVIIGHSSKRAQGETDTTINQKIKKALGEKFKVILCVGEPLSVRTMGLDSVKTFIKDQLEKDLKNISTLYPTPYTLLIAYEPIWAITTNAVSLSDKPEDSLEIIKFIKQFLNTNYRGLPSAKITTEDSPLQKLKANSYKLKARVLYGGSINSKNISSFLSHPEIDGLLIGHTSTQKAEFSKILKKI